ncbi:hypothetical protein DCAR_0935452 [Daucus carota subsp. sativus]|uniref:Uncharacterized protein n=1 Tax=Daucus carota subsp. sativus TaxID=79200 RepID=A0AAF1BE01_DAUCS|nr:PREDICTED: phylloplanin-like isoform X2 [Daucus carota subsp. sativus]WOH15905.1 hypothetical protein DCAR_0935452 [Daucus carota subsp. sativus]
MADPSSVEAQIIPGLAPPIFPAALPHLLNISGTVFCTPNVTVSDNGTLPPNLQPFPNANVMLKCGNTTMANTTTNASGNFNIVSNRFSLICAVLPFLLQRGILLDPFLLKGGECQAIVKEPPSSCHVSLPTTGNLVAQILPMNGTLPVIGGIVNLGVALFSCWVSIF